MPELYVLEELRSYLIAQGLVQAQSAAASLVLPRIYLNPKDGAPTPASGENVTVTLVDTLLTGPPNLEAWLEEAFVDIRVRSRTATPGKLLQRQIRGLIAPTGQLYGRKHWTMNTLLVEYSTLWRGDQSLPPDVDGWTRVQSFRFGVRRSVLST